MIFHIWKFILLSTILFSAYCSGLIVLKIARFNQIPIIRQFINLLSISLGLGVLAYSTLLIGLLGWLHSIVIYGIIIFYILLGIYYVESYKIIYILYIRLKDIVGSISQMNWFIRLLIIFLLILIFNNIIGSLAPPLGVDDIKYHFAIPKRYLNAGIITYIPDFGWSNLPFTMEMLWTLAMAVDSAELAQLLNASIGIIIIFFIYSFGRNLHLTREFSIISVLLFYSISNVSYSSQSGNVELGATLFFISGAYILITSRAIQDSSGPIILAAIFFGLFSSTKSLYISFALMFTIFIVIREWKQNKSLIYGLKNSILFGSIILVVSGVWYLKSFIYTGNPIYPLFTSIFGVPLINNDLLYEKLLFEKREYLHLSQFPKTVYTLFLDLLFFQDTSKGYISPLFLSLLPVYIINFNKSESNIKEVGLLLIIYYIIWSVTYPYVRIGLPIFSIFSIIIADTIKSIFHNKIFIGAVIKILLSLFILVSIASQLRLINSKIPIVAYPNNKNLYITNNAPTKRYRFYNYPAIVFMNNNLPRDAKVLLWSNDGYYMDINYLYALGFITTMASGEKLYDSKEVINELSRFGITHVAMTDNYLRMALRETLEESNQLKILYEDYHMKIGALP